MAFVGHKFAQTPHSVQEVSSATLGFLFDPSSKTPWGQTPTQTKPEQGAHLAGSIDKCALRVSMESQQLNKCQEYICCAKGEPA
jgi:hypothetical protein